MQQVAVRGMDLERVEAEPRGAPRRAREVVADLLQAGGVERRRRVLAARRAARADGATALPAARLAERDLRAAFPRRAARGLAAGMRELHRQLDRRVGAHGAQHAGQRGFVGVAVQAEVGRRDPALGRDRGRLDDQQRRARQREVAEVDQVPVGRRALVGASTGTSAR